MFSYDVIPAFLPIPVYTPIGIYQPPQDMEEAQLRSKVNRRILRHPRLLLKALLPSGRVRGGVFGSGSIAIALEDVVLTPSGVSLAPGEWINFQSGVRGRDPIELVASFQGCTYASAVGIIARHLGVDTAREHDDQAGDWVQDLHPVRPFFPLLPYPSRPYRNVDGNIFAVVESVYGRNGETVPVFHTIWKNRRTGRCVVLEAFPAKPYPIYNLSSIIRNPQADVVLVQDEASADATFIQGFIFSTIPGGLEHFQDADFSPLKGRRIFLQLWPKDVCRARVIAQKLRSIEVKEVHVSVDGRNYHPFSDLEAVAGRLGIDLLPEIEAPTASSGLVAPDLGTLIAMPIPPRDWILEGLILNQDLVMLHAPRGVGKTHFAWGIARACATGSGFLRWRAPRPRKVVYLDGEMSVASLRERLMAMASAHDDLAAKNIRILTPDLQAGPMPDLSTAEGRGVVDPLLEDGCLLVIDNLASLLRSGSENDGSSWLGMQTWLLDLRRRGITVLIVHHSGKNGGQRGTSRREDVLDVVIELRRPADYTPTEGARFEVHLTKARAVCGDAAKPFEASLTTIDGKAVWSTRDITDDRVVEAADLFEQGISIRSVAAKLGISRSAAGRLRQKLIEDGWIGDKTDSDEGG